MLLIFRNALTVGIIAALLAVVVDTVAGHRNIEDLAATDERVTKSHAVQDSLDKLLSTIKDAETGQRGYILTNDPRFQEPYDRALVELPVRLAQVRRLTQELPDHQQKLDEIAGLTEQKLDELRLVIDTFREKGSTPALDIVRQGHGRKYMDLLRQKVGEMQAEEESLLADRNRAAAESLLRARVMNLIGGGLGVGLVGLAFYLFRRQLLTGESAAADLRRANDELEARVARRTAALKEAGDQLERRVADRTAELSAANDRLAEADRRKDEFLAMLAHELRNPLAPIRNAVSLLRKRPANDPVVDQMSAMLDRQVTHLAQLVDDLMDMARITSGKIELRLAPTELGNVVRRTLEAVAPLLAERKHKFAADVPDQPVWVRGDPVRLEQILNNLLQNAAKYTQPGGQVRVALVTADGAAELRVADSGIGIRKEMLPRIFDLFQQGDRVQGRLIEGLGIGLTLVRNLVNLHGGTVEAKSAGLGRGSEFIVRLPLTTPGGSVHVAPARPVYRARRVLVVDDNKDAADSLAAVLRHAGHEANVVHDGPAALAAAAAATPEVVLLDIGMPVMDGYEVARRLRQAPGFDHTPIIALTGFGSAEDHRRSREAGFSQHLTKPVDPEVLLDMLARV
jgi:signal transduction histidine kinase/CheY-like chemotaxis protein